MIFEIFAPKKMGIRDGKLRKAVVQAETPAEQEELFIAIEQLSADGWPRLERERRDQALAIRSGASQMETGNDSDS